MEKQKKKQIYLVFFEFINIYLIWNKGFLLVHSRKIIIF